jgi:arabinogalactan oligomer/maltooligosaccharide transport system substrate-binding protein
LRDEKQNPAERGFYQGFAVGRRRTHCVTSTQKVYAIEDERAIPARILTLLSMDRLPDLSEISFMHGSSLVVVAEGMIMVYLIARGHRHGRKSFTPIFSTCPIRVAGKVPFSR